MNAPTDTATTTNQSGGPNRGRRRIVGGLTAFTIAVAALVPGGLAEAAGGGPSVAASVNSVAQAGVDNTKLMLGLGLIALGLGSIAALLTRDRRDLPTP